MPTDDMLAAGADAINAQLGMGPPIKGFDAWKAAEACFIAMQKVAPKVLVAEQKKASSLTLKLDTADLERVVAEFHETVKSFIEAVALVAESEDEETE